MYWLIESDNQLREFYNKGYKEAFVDVIQSDPSLHPADSSVSLVYIRPVESSKGFIISINHTEALHVQQNKVFKVLSKFEVLYCTDKKRLLHHFGLHNFYDINRPPGKYEEDWTDTHQIFQRLHKGLGNLNKIIPIVKHYEAMEGVYSLFRNRLNKDKGRYAEFYNDRATMVYHNIERNGMGINRELFFKHFYNRDKPVVYGQYNLNTTTTRPSNKFGGVNYAALNKKTGERSAFVCKNDYFVEFDVMAYHPVIVSQMIGYEFKDRDIHQSFADMYGVSRDKAKEITFQQFYGRIFAEYKDLRYFTLLLRKQEELIEKYNKDGYVEEEISGYRFSKEVLGDISQEKLFNYYLQATESSMNVLILEDIQSILKDTKTQIILTVYDSFLLDVKKGEEEKLKEIQRVFNNRKLNTTIKSGYDYNFKS